MRERLKTLQTVLAVLVFVAGSGTAWAQSSSSTNYRVDQTFFGSGGELDASSANYHAKQTAGELGVGYTCSTDYCAVAGFNTTDVPFLEFVVTADNIDLGYLDTAQTKVAEGTFVVRAWQSGGYSITTGSDPPTNTGPNAQQISPLAAQAASTPGTEQFGINLVRNPDFPTTGVDTGADPQPIPADGSLSFGQVDNDYNDAGLFRYIKGDQLAFSDQSTSITQYTISYIFNINNTTPSGEYIFRHTLVATGTY